MTDELRIARNYLIAPGESFWQWCDRGEVITWADGRTIAFRAELADVLLHLAPQGLPPLSAIVLLLAATRDNWGDVPRESGILAGWLRFFDVMSMAKTPLENAMDGLEKVHRLEPQLRTSPEAKCVLAEVIFEGSPRRTSPQDAAVIAETISHRLEEMISQPEESGSPQAYGAGSFLGDLACLQPGLDRLDAEVLRLRKQTGLNELPQAAEIELSPSERVRLLLAELKNDDELSGLAKLALNLMAAVTLPRPVADRDELQVGGISDITNRGPLDRLLLSELAHDDLTLAVRVAVNEALYLRRESPPRMPPQQRSVLLDVGIRSWGVPRVFATAVALALAATPERNMEVVTYRAKGSEVEPVDLTTRAGIVAHLEALEADIHPGQSLGAFLAETALAENLAEPILVTTDDVVDDHEFQRSLDEQDVTPLHIGAINRDGRFRLLERTSRGSKQLKEVQLDLAELFQQPDRVTPTLIDRDWARDLPAIFSVEPFPLLLSHNIDPKRSWCVQQQGVLAVTKDRRLMFWEKPGQGARQLMDNVPRGALWWSEHEAFEGIAHAVVGYMSPDGLHLLRMDLDQGRCESRPLQAERGVLGICSHNGVLFAVFMDKVQVASIETGEIIQTLQLPGGMRWLRDRFFRGNPSDRLHALSYDGRTARLEKVLDEKDGRCPTLLTLFERDGIDGPIGITSRGDLYSTSTKQLRKVHLEFSGDLNVKAVSPNGRNIMIGPSRDGHISTSRAAVILDTDTLGVSSYHGGPEWSIQPEFSDCVRPANLRHRFTNIRVDENGMIILTSRKQHYLRIQSGPGSDCVLLREVPSAQVNSQPLVFEAVKTPAKIGIQLSCATWNDGSEAFLDSRGLLHLRSSDTSIPEVSLVLTDGAMAGWCSDGRCWGADYFTGARQDVSVKEVFDKTIRAFGERLRS